SRRPCSRGASPSGYWPRWRAPSSPPGTPRGWIRRERSRGRQRAFWTLRSARFPGPSVSTTAKRQPVPVGKYLRLDRINTGGMAEVWRGKMFGAGGFERLVAIKRILPNIAEDEEFITMFIDEAKISVQLTHANIAQIYELGHINNSYFIAMEYIPGKDMRA